MGRPALIHIAVGERFGRLIAIQRVPGKRGEIRWLCKCDCGNPTDVAGQHLVSGHTKSCGCFLRDSRRTNTLTHGMAQTPTYNSWSAMRARCYNPKNNRFYLYGARRITVCKRWRFSFSNFLADMGVRPPHLSLDRKDTNGNYEPDNCRWATAQQQMAGRRKFHHRKKRVYGKKASQK